MARPSKFKPHYCDLLIDIFSDGGTINAFCVATGISKRTFFYWRRAYPDFEEAYDMAYCRALYYWEQLLIKMVTRRMKCSKRDPMTVLKILKWRFPEVYKGEGKPDPLAAWRVKEARLVQ